MKRYLWIFILVTLLLSACGSSKTQLSVDSAMQAFRDAGLECENPELIGPNDSILLPKTFLEAKRCVVPSVDEDHGLRVFSFETDDDLKVVKDYYESFSGVFASYVYVRDNLLFQTSVSMPKELADQYEEIFETFQP